ncbi:hypothetical protein JOY44_08500 [Phormidium sp. CLA17]|uniref:hypothetical protein n=1 Tax=Leptolyngbya sp. Cla-17 TaxID=2803751 RepID=UPI0014913A16|nr:hypothetical protein [Leptolyngbya sp. Cla-17]MBM0741655.1 hypothetical protein [Leptolyngbya sp. Cla-17]
MTNEANDIFKQARQGSVAAIIQVLNEKLADSGVRTRAIFADGVLQLLCEGVTLEQLDQIPLVERIRQILEAIAPRNIRRVNINSRIVREQQLLWLEEISRDPVKQVLWSEEIVLKKPSLLKQWSDDWSDRSAEQAKSDVTRASVVKPRLSKHREQSQFRRGVIGGAIVSCLLLAGGWFFYNRFGTSTANDLQAEMKPTSAQSNTAPQTTNSATSPSPVVSSTSSSSVDAFVEAVRLAESTSTTSQSAKSSAEWLSLAAQWQKASDLMATVSSTDNRYKTAQDRVATYRKNSEVSLEVARRNQNSATTEAPQTPAGQL